MLTYFQILQLVSFTLIMSLGQILFKKTAISIALSSNEGLGLIGIAERVGQINGSLEVIKKKFFKIIIKIG